MKKTYIFLILLFLLSFQVKPQCGDFGEYISADLNNLRFFDQNVGVAFSHNSMIRTQDGGETWENVSLPALPLYQSGMIDCEILDENTALISGYKSLIKTTDKGVTWYSIPLKSHSLDRNIKNVKISFVDSSTGFMILERQTSDYFYDYKFLKTTDSGETWSLISGIPFLYGSYGDFSIIFVNENMGIVYSGQYIYRTENGGANWQEVDNPTLSGINGESIGKLTVLDNRIVASFKSTIPKYYLSEDFGSTFYEIQEFKSLSSEDLTYVTSTNFYIDGEDNIYTIGWTDGVKSIFKYNIEATSLESIYVDENIDVFLGKNTKVFVRNIDEIFLFDGHNNTGDSALGRKLIKSVNGGVSWNEIDSFTAFNSSDRIDLKENFSGVYTLAKYNNNSSAETAFNLYISNNNGATWQQKVKQSELGKLLMVEGSYISYISEAEDYEYTSEIILRESDDLGETWEESSFVSSVDLWSFSQIDSDTFLLKDFNNYSVSLDKGATWFEISFPDAIANDDRTLVANAIDEIYVWGYNNTGLGVFLYKSTDLGENWFQIMSLPSAFFSEVNMTFGENFAFVGASVDTFYKVNLLTNTYEQMFFENPSYSGTVPQNYMHILSDNIWVMAPNGAAIFISYDQGATWSASYALIGDSMFLNSFNEIISHSGSYTFSDNCRIMRSKSYIPNTPALLMGNTNVDINSEENYYVSYDGYADSEWELLSGGTIEDINNAGQYVVVNWTEPGDHQIRVKYVNDCGESDYKVLTVTVVDNLSVDDLIKPEVLVSPNPFNNEINIVFQDLQEKLDVKILSLAGQVVYEKHYNSLSEIRIINLGKLSSGVYFLTIKNGNSTYVKKIIKK